MPFDIIIGRNESDKKAFGNKGLAFIGKSFVTMGNYTSLSNPIFMDVARSHVILVSGKRGCLTGNTMIFTDKGHKSIETFNEKYDKVLSFNKETKDFEWECAKLLKYDIEKKENMYKIEVEDGRSVIITKEHPLLIKRNGEKFYEKAFNICLGDKVLKVTNLPKDFSLKSDIDYKTEWLTISCISKLNGIRQVYDLSVDKNHSFIANGIISHNSGKSYTLGTIAEALSDLGVEESGNIAPLIFDTMGIFWTMKYKNVKDEVLLDEWGLKAKNVPMKVFAPFGYYQEYKDKGVDIDAEFAIKISELGPSDWVTLFELKFTDAIAVVIESVISELKESRESFSFEDIYDLIGRAENVGQEVKNSAMALFDAAKTWKVFDEEKGTSVRELVSAGTTTVIDLSMYASLGAFNVRALIIGLVSKKIFNERMASRKDEEIQAVQHGADYARYQVKREMPLVWIFVDEMHEFLPREGETPATDALVQLLREGRQPGISLVMATQQPGKIHTDAMTQSDIVISHRVTAKLDVEALNDITQSYMYENISAKINELPRLKGSAIILDDNSERIYPMRVRPRWTWHGGEAPTAIKKSDF